MNKNKKNKNKNKKMNGLIHFFIVAIFHKLNRPLFLRFIIFTTFFRKNINIDIYPSLMNLNLIYFLM